jgi:alpha-beta hydrolase superfamily lysophospholipase
VQVSREGASRLPDATLAEFAGARHDVLNEQAYDAVAATIAAWMLAHVPVPASLVGLDD